MDKFMCLTLLIFIFFQVTLSTTNVTTQTYIIHMDNSRIPSPFSSHHFWYMSTLFLLSSYETTLSVHLYTYTNAFSGFSVVLTEFQLSQLEGMSGHISTYPELYGHHCTTHTPQFLGLTMETGLWPRAKFGDDMIIGIVDSGIWPESDSFNDDGMPPVPPHWHGACETGHAFALSNCNNKLIGARFFNKGIKKSGLDILDYESPRDYEGHGTYVSSIAVGSQVPFTNYFGYANGTTTGMAYKSRLAIYKALFNTRFGNNYSAAASDFLAGIDQAIEDKVDLLSISIVFRKSKLYEDPISIGTFAAIERGIFVSAAAGNYGPNKYTIYNGAPWITTVGAGTIDRCLVACVTLGESGTQFLGKSIFPENLMVDKIPLYFGHGNKSKEICINLDPTEVEGKYVYCDYVHNGLESIFNKVLLISTTGAAGAIFSTNDESFIDSSDFNGSYIIVNPQDGELVKKYIMDHGIHRSIVSIKFQLTLLGTKPAPLVPDFSSRGPVLGAPWILKPDLLAPGVNILAAWVPNQKSSSVWHGLLQSDYSIGSGTSSSTAHVIGVAALLKSIHKQWSPAAIRSAMMTTAYIMDNTNHTLHLYDGVSASPLDFGAGHINPTKAMDPGLVYDLEVEDYIKYLCSLNFTRVKLQAITRRSNVTCNNVNTDLNYPSFIIIVNKLNETSVTFKRVLTNVFDGNCTYSAIVEAPSGMKVLVEPSVINFPRKFYKSDFKLTIVINLENMTRIDYLCSHGYLSWKEVNGSHVVNSPIVSAYPAYE